MDYENYLSKVTRWLKKDDVAGAIADLELRIQKLPVSPFHKAVGRNWLKQQSQLATWLKKIFSAGSKQFGVKALYVEMNRFDINTDRWYLDGFAYDEFGGDDDIEWLCNSKYTTEDAEQFKLTGMSDLQKAYASLATTESAFPDAEAAVVLLLTLKMLEVVQAAAKDARAKGWIPEDVPVVAAAHEADPTQCFYGAVKPKKKREPTTNLPVASAEPPASGWAGIYEPTTNDPKGNSYPFPSIAHTSYSKSPSGDHDSIQPISRQLSNALSSPASSAKDWKKITDLTIFPRKKGWDCEIMSVSHGQCCWAFSDSAKGAVAPLLGSHAEFLPIQTTNGPTLWILHVLTVVKLSKAASRRLDEEGELKLDPKQVRDLPIFRYEAIDSDAEEEFFVSEAVKRACAEKGLTGWLFEEVCRFKVGK